MTAFERALDECLDALRNGADIDACLCKYPEHAAELRACLEAAAAVAHAFDAEPAADFVRDARRRFTVASGRTVRQAFDAEPSPSFFAAARMRFLLAAQRMRLGERASRPARGWGFFGAHARALASVAAGLVLFFGFSGYTVASAGDALPGDWRYPIKRQTERVRLALAFSDDAERSVRLDIVAERAEEIEKLAARGDTIGADELMRLKNETEPLLEAAEKGELDPGQAERLQALSERAKVVLDDAAADAKVASDAQDVLDETRTVVAASALKAGEVAVNARRGPAVLTPTVPERTPTAGPTEPLATPTGVATTEPGATPTEPAPGTTPSAPTPVPPTPVVTAPAREGLVVEATPITIAHDITWVRLSVADFSTLIPSEQDSWRIAGVNVADGPAAAPTLIQLSNVDGTQLISINPRNGDLYWFVAVNGVFDEVQLRLTIDGETLVVDRDLLRHLYGPLAEIPLFILDNMEIGPPPPPPLDLSTPIPTPS